MRTIVIAVLWVVSVAFAADPVRAQQVSAPLVRDAVPSKPSSTEDTRTLMIAAPMRVWLESDPVRVKGDLKGHDDAAASQYRPRKQADPLVRPARPRTGAAPTLAPSVGMNFDGIPATGVLPPDTVGAVGPSHYIQMVNSAFAIYDKNGALLAGPSQINALWAGFGGPCETDNDGDPIARYDHLANRWLLAQFAIDKNMQCVAISRGANPVTGGWFLYAFRTLDAGGQPVTPDYPKIGVWPDGYYMSTQRGFPSSGLDVWVFERDRMLAGQPARQVQFALGAPSIVLQPSDLNGPAPPAGTPNFFIRQVDGQRFGGQDRIEVFAFSVNWANPSASTFQLITSLSTGAFDSVLCASDLMGACVSQPGTSQRLETLTAWPMFRAQYRNFGTREVLLLNHTVDATGQDRAGVRWYELRRQPGGPWTIFQQATHSPDSTHRWMGSVAMDGAGNIALGYSVSSPQTFPGIRVATRRPSDPAGTFGPEVTVVNGGGSQTHPAARWGDYSSMDVDPVQPCTFWFTTLYYASTSAAGWRTRIAEVRMPPAQCSGVSPSSELYQLHSDGRVLRHTGVPCSGESCPGWQMLDNTLKTVTIAAGGSQLYQLQNDGRIWKHTGTPCSGETCPGWQMLDNNPRTRAIAATGEDLYQLHHDGRTWKYTGTPCSGESCPGWQMLDNNPRTVGLAAGGVNLYQVHNSGRIWKHTGTPCSGESCPGWQMLDNNPRAVDLAAAGVSLYQLHNSGGIWKHTGTPCSGGTCPG